MILKYGKSWIAFAWILPAAAFLVGCGHVAGENGEAPTPRVLVIGHRGNSIAAPENTLTAIEDAFRVGADVVEVDVRRSLDGVLYLFHDDVLDRTSDGNGPVGGREFSELRALDVGTWFHPRYAGAHIPTLEEAIRVAALHEGRLLLDLKEPAVRAEQVASVLHRLSMPDQILVIGAWTEQHLAEFPKLLPGAELLWMARMPQSADAAFFDDARARGIQGFETDFPVSEAFMKDANENDMPIIVFTVNDAPSLRHLLRLGVAGIETDDPALLVELAREQGRR